MGEKGHIHIQRKRGKSDIKEYVRNINSGYLQVWRTMAQEPFTFPIAVGMYPIALVAKTTAMVIGRMRSRI